MNFRRSSVACTLAVAAALLGLAWSQSPAASEQKCAVEGLVVNARSGVPLKMAEVTLQRIDGGASAKTRTKPGGWFSFANLQPGDYRLSAARTGFVSQEYDSNGSGRHGETLALQPGDQLRGVVIRLSPKGVIAGRIVDEDGEPVSDVHVQALRFMYTSNGPGLSTNKIATTNDLGEYRLYGLDPGRYYISASYSGSGVEQAGGSSREIYGPTYFPGTSDPSAAAPFEVTAGSETLGAEFSLLRTRTYHMRGRVVNAPEEGPARRVSVVILPRSSSGLGAAVVKSTSAEMPSGTFEIGNMVPGSYIATAYFSEGDQRYFARQSVEVAGADVDGVYLALGPGVDLPGRFRVEGQGEIRLNLLSVLLQPKERLPVGAVLSKVSRDGAVLLKSLPAGEYEVRVNGVPKGFYLKSLRLAGEDLLQSGLRITGGQPPGELEGTLSSAGGAIDGTVREDKQGPVEGAQVVLIPGPDRRGQTYLYRAATTDRHGRFQMRDIVPGDYKLFAWKDLDPGAYLSQEFLNSWEARGEPVDIQENGRQNFQLKLLSTEASSPPGR